MENQAPENTSASPAKPASQLAQNSSAGPVERKNFMKPQFENALEKREKFAVNLRKKKTQEIVKAKRRKIIEALGSKGSGQILGGLNGAAMADAKEDIDLSLEEMQNQYYQGYPEWRKNKYSDQKKLLDAMATTASWEAYATSSNSQKVQYLLNLLTTQQNEAIQQLALITKVRQEMADGKETPKIDEIISQTSILEVITQVLGAEDGNDLTRYLKLEATWILTNLAYGSEQDMMIVLDSKFAILDHLNRILEGNDLQMIDQAIWFIANACGESLNLRNLILTQTTIIKALTRIISDAQRMNASIRKGLLKSVIWCVCNICRSKKNAFHQNQTEGQKGSQMHVLSLEEYTQILYIITTFIDCKEMSRSMIDAMWALAYIAENAEDNFITQICQSQSMIEAIIGYLTSPLQEEQVPALRAAGNILATSNQENVDIFIFHKGLDALSGLLEVALKQHYPTQFFKELCWGLSNVTAGSQQNIESVFSNPKLVEQIYTCMKSQILEIRREATYVMTNAITTTDEFPMLDFISNFNGGEIIPILVTNLKMNDASVITEIIQSFTSLMKLDKAVPLEGEASIAYRFEVAGGLDELETLQKHPNIKIYQEVETFISQHFESEPENDMIHQDQNSYQSQNGVPNSGPGRIQGGDTNMFQI